LRIIFKRIIIPILSGFPASSTAFFSIGGGKIRKAEERKQENIKKKILRVILENLISVEF